MVMNIGTNFAALQGIAAGSMVGPNIQGTTASGGINLGTGLGLASGFLGGISNIFTSLNQASYQKSIAKYNQRVANIQADQAIKIGNEQEQAYRQQVKQLIGQQRLSYAAQGVVVDQGTAATVQEQTAKIGEIDALTIRNNAALQAWGYKAQAVQSSAAGSMASAAGVGRALSSANQTFSNLSWYAAQRGL